MVEIKASTADLAVIHPEDDAMYEMQREGGLVSMEDPATEKQYNIAEGVRTDQDDHAVFLGANEVFFNTPGKLRCKRQRASTDVLNDKSFFAGVQNIYRKRDALYWPLFVRPDVGNVPELTYQAPPPTQTGGGGGGEKGMDVAILADPQIKTGVSYSVHFDVKMIPHKLRGRSVSGGSKTPTFVVCVDGDEAKVLHVLAAPSKVKYALQFDVEGLTPGFHTLEMWLLNPYKTTAGPGLLCYLKATCPSQRLTIVRERWRPWATHLRFKASQAPVASAWVMSQRKAGAKPWLSSYNPMTTPYGYAGFSFGSDGKVLGDHGMNFSLWSYGKGQRRPPMRKMSRLLGCGHPTAEFSHFDDEGHGEKFRGWTGQWKGNTSGNYVTYQDYQLEKNYVYSDGRIYSFRSFFWDESADDVDGGKMPGRWRFYAEGQKFIGGRRQIKSLPIGSFIEIPGRADRQRSGHVSRAVCYRGYARNKNTDTWHPIDRLQNFPDMFTNKRWETNGATFVASAGGLEYRKLDGPQWLELENANVEEPMKKEKEEDIEFPLGIGMSDAEDEDEEPAREKNEEPLFIQRIHQIDLPLPYPTIVSYRNMIDGTVQITVSIPQKEHAESEVTVFWGTTDSLTLERYWDNKTKPVMVKGKQAIVTLTGGQTGKQHFARVWMRDASSQLFSRDTFRFSF